MNESVIFLLDSVSVALMNHSCNPNVIVTYKGTVAEVRAVQEINPGDEVSPLGGALTPPHEPSALSSPPCVGLQQLHRPALPHRGPQGEAARLLLLHLPVQRVHHRVQGNATPEVKPDRADVKPSPLQDKEKMKIRKSKGPVEPEEVQSMVCYARNLIEEFRRAKHYKNILSLGSFWSCLL